MKNKNLKDFQLILNCSENFKYYAFKGKSKKENFQISCLSLEKEIQ